MTDTLRFRRALRLVLSGGILLALCLACTVEEGERSSTGECPEGEVCSSESTGLRFYGPPPTDDASAELLPRVASMGTMNLHFERADGLELGVHAVESSSPWVFTVEDAAEQEEGGVVLWDGLDDVRLDGVTPGESFLEVRDGNGDLHDRVMITVERVARADVEILGEATPGARVSAVFQIFGETQLRLIDESMTIESEDAEIERVSWDCVDFVVPDEGDEVTFTITAGHRRWDVTAPIVR